MTILPYDKHLGRWQRAKIRAHGLVKDFKDWRGDGNATLPDWWNPEQLERSYAEVLAETEKARQDDATKR
jgi:hypothetical protein